MMPELQVVTVSSFFFRYCVLVSVVLDFIRAETWVKISFLGIPLQNFYLPPHDLQGPPRPR